MGKAALVSSTNFLVRESLRPFCPFAPPFLFGCSVNYEMKPFAMAQYVYNTGESVSISKLSSEEDSSSSSVKDMPVI